MERPPSSAAALRPLPSPPPAADGNEDADSPPLFQRIRSLRPLYQALSVAVLSSALCALLFSPLPLWRPVGVLMLHKLWDILSFLALTAITGLGILNSRLWRDSRDGKLGRDDSSTGDGGGDSVNSKLPFAGMYSSFEKVHNTESDVPGRTESGRKGSDRGRKQSSENSTPNAKNESMSASASMSTTRHNRSRSAHDFNKSIALQEKPPQKSRQGAGRQLARRRNVSLSCDMDKDYRSGGLPPSWREGLLSPPMPPQLISGDASKGTGASGHDESSLRKAFTESLAPWRVEAIAMPVQNERRTIEGRIDPSRKGHKREAFSQGNIGQAIPPSTPSTPKPYVGSPSPSELNKKVDAFIARFHERNRLQRLESLERARRTAR